MARNRAPHLATGLLAALATDTLHAAGGQLLEQNASGIGSAYAGSAAVAENASTVFFNPAAMTLLAPREVSLGLSAVRPRFELKNEGSLGGPLSGSGGDAGSWALVPNAYLTWALGSRLTAGLGVSAPFGLVTKYDADWVGAAQAVKFELRTLNLNPSLAWRINDQWSVGLGANWQRLDVNYRRAVAIANGALASTYVTFDADNDAWGWNAGVLWLPSPATRIGLSYRSSVDHEVEGKLKFRGTLAGAFPSLSNAPAKAQVELPDTWILSVVQRIDARWEMLGDVSRTGWSSIPKVDIVRIPGGVVQTLDSDFRDTWRFALGAHYHLNDAWKLKFGVAYDQTPVRHPGTRLVSLPDSNRTWFSFGGQWTPIPGNRFDLGVAYLLIPKTGINNDQITAGRGRVTGEYDSSVWLLGGQYSLAF